MDSNLESKRVSSRVFGVLAVPPPNIVLKTMFDGTIVRPYYKSLNEPNNKPNLTSIQAQLASN